MVLLSGMLSDELEEKKRLKLSLSSSVVHSLVWVRNVGMPRFSVFINLT